LILAVSDFPRICIPFIRSQNFIIPFYTFFIRHLLNCNYPFGVCRNIYIPFNYFMCLLNLIRPNSSCLYDLILKMHLCILLIMYRVVLPNLRCKFIILIKISIKLCNFNKNIIFMSGELIMSHMLSLMGRN